MNRLQACSLLSVLAIAPVGEISAAQDVSPWSVNAKISIGSDDNLTQAEQANDIAKDQFAELVTSLAYSRLLTVKQGYTFAGFAKLKGHEKFSSLNSHTLGASAIYRIQPILGFTQPIYQFSTTLRVEEFDFKQRDSTTVEFRALMKKRFTDKLSASLGLEHQSVESDGSVFDTRRSKIFSNFDLSLNSSSNVYLALNYIDGDSVSSGFANTQKFKVINAQEAFEKDQAFSKTLTGTWMAYRIPAKMRTYKIGLKRKLGRTTSIDLSALMADVQGQGDNNYRRIISRLSLSKKF